MWLLMYLLKIDSALWGVHHSYRVGPAGYRRSRFTAGYICKILEIVRIMRAFNSRTKRATDRPIPTDRPTELFPHFDGATTRLTYTHSRARVLFFNSRIACICEHLNIGSPGCAHLLRIKVNPHFINSGVVLCCIVLGIHVLCMCWVF